MVGVKVVIYINNYHFLKRYTINEGRVPINLHQNLQTMVQLNFFVKFSISIYYLSPSKKFGNSWDVQYSVQRRQLIFF